MRAVNIIGLALALFAEQTLAQTTRTNFLADTNSSQPVEEEETERSWSFSASVYIYLVPDDRDYAQPTITFDRDWLHLETRYNYENLETASAWVGYNFNWGEKLSLELTPMLGGVFGDTTGVAPGYKYTVSWKKLELYSEGEYVFDTHDSSESFFYTWSELTLSPVDWFRFGLVIQRTKVYETDFDIQRGFLIGFNYKKLNLTCCVFNPDENRPIVVLGAGLDF